MHQQTVYFRAPDAKFYYPGRGYTPPRSSPSRSLRSLAVLLGGPLTRIFESPEKFLVTGLHHMPSDYLLCQTLLSVEQSSNIASISVVLPILFFSS